MDDFLGFLVMVVYLIAVFFGKKNKTQRGKQKQRRGFERVFSSETKKGKRQREMRHEDEACQGVLAASDLIKDCEAQRVHLHAVTQQQMHDAGEGEDPCHAGRAPEVTDEMLYACEDETDSDLAKDVLRGVIMSEILMRPCERMAIRRNRRSAT